MIRQFVPLIGPDDGERVRGQIDSTFVGCGETVAEFERAVATHSGVRHCVATTSGTVALMLALLAAARTDRPRKILFPAYTFLAGANAARLLGLDVELVDIEPDTLCMSPRLLNERLEEAGPVAAVIYVDHNAYVGGRREEVRAVCERFEVPLVEDSAQCFGVLGGLAGHVGIFSFSVPKLVTTGQGGCVITDDDELAATVRDISDQGGGWRERRIHQRVGGNFKFNDILAAYGLSQISRLTQLLTLRKAVFDRYRSRIPLLDHGMASAWMVIHRARDAAEMSESLATRGIQAVQYYRPVHHNPPFYSNSHYPEAEAAYRECLYLPSSLSLTPEEIDHICDAVREAESGSIARPPPAKAGKGPPSPSAASRATPPPP